ncbi:hypothetical protein K2Y11_06255 [bacterium]|nr:hypothetical protein [bacterium]
MEQPPVRPSHVNEGTSVPASPSTLPDLISHRPETNAYERMETFLAEREKLEYLPKLSPLQEIATQT